MSFTVAIVGRPNVGKSTLFNRLVGKRLAIVDNEPGVTRDRREGHGRIADMSFGVIDTAGLEDAKDGLEAVMRDQTGRAVADADVALMVIDARAGLTPLDEHFAGWLRRTETPVILVANKCEHRTGQSGVMEAYALGLGDPIPISAEHGLGMADLFSALAPFAEANENSAAAEKKTEAPLQLAVVGRPNVGKSTLINRLIGEERVLTGPQSGITRDAVSLSWEFEGHAVRLVDTAGMRRKAKVRKKLESLSVKDGLRAIRFAQVVVLVLDGSLAEADQDARSGDGNILEKQDLAIARQVTDEGRALIIAINKWDLVGDRKKALQGVGERLEKSLPQVRDVPVVAFSALTGGGVGGLMPKVMEAYRVWNRRLATGVLNRWLAEMVERHPPPLAKGRRVKLRYMTQAKTRPPTFVVFTSRPDALPDAYRRYLVNGLRDAFNIPGVPLRLILRKGENPYAKDRK